MLLVDGNDDTLAQTADPVITHQVFVEGVLDDRGHVDMVDDAAVAVASIVIEQRATQRAIGCRLQFAINGGIYLEAGLVDFLAILLE